jgi:hypothetical protein
VPYTHSSVQRFVAMFGADVASLIQRTGERFSSCIANLPLGFIRAAARRRGLRGGETARDGFNGVLRVARCLQDLLLRAKTQ